MLSADGNADLKPVLLEILQDMPEGFVFDSSFVFKKLWEGYSDHYSKFLLTFQDTAGKAGKAEIERVLDSWVGTLLEQIDLKIHFAGLADSLGSQKIWKKI